MGDVGHDTADRVGSGAQVEAHGFADEVLNDTGRVDDAERANRRGVHGENVLGV